jgi:CheY-like chemotaxis protein
MRAPAEVLVLEDDPRQLRALQRLVQVAHLEPLATSSPRQAMARLERHQPILAIIDLDMSLAPVADRLVSVHDLLRRLHQRHVNCIPLVYSAAVETIDDQAAVYLSHPHALFQSKRHGDRQLLERVNGLLSGRVGDLAVQEGVVVHLPSGQTFAHRVAVALLTARRANRALLLSESDARAARRFQDWLQAHSSSVLVRPLGGRHYQLGEREGG